MSDTTPVTPVTTTPDAAVSTAPTRPTYGGLFPEQITDKCQTDALECAYGPFAYLSELHKKALTIEKSGAVSKIFSLATRRPDIGELFLDQNSLDSKVPTLKLVIEALSRQALAHTGNKPVVDALASAVRHHNLPFHHSLEQIKAVLEHKKLSHFDLLQQTEYSHPNFCYGNLRTDELRAVMRNACGLSPALQELLLDDTAPTSKNYFKSRFGVAGNAATAVAALCDVDLFCKRTGLKTDEVLEMLALSSVPDDATEGLSAVRRSTAYCPGTDEAPGAHLYGAAFINKGLTPLLNLEDSKAGPGTQLRFRNATPAHFQRIHKLIHLRAALGLSFAQTDLLLASAMAAQNAHNTRSIGEGTLRALGVFNLLRERHGITVEQYAALLCEVSPYSVGSDTAFLDRILDGPGTGQLAAAGDRLIVDNREFTLLGDADDQGHRPYSAIVGQLSLVLGVEEQLTHRYLNQVIDQQALETPRLSLGLITSLYRLSRLPRLLKLSQANGTALLDLLAIDNPDIYRQLAGSPSISDDAEHSDLLDVLVGITNLERWLRQNRLTASQVLAWVKPHEAGSTSQVVSPAIREAVAHALPQLRETLLSAELSAKEAASPAKSPWTTILAKVIGFQGLIRPLPQAAMKDLHAYLLGLLTPHYDAADEASKVASDLVPMINIARNAQEAIAKQILTDVLGHSGQRLESDHTLYLLKSAGSSTYNVLCDMLAAAAHDLTAAEPDAKPLSMLTPALWHYLQRYALAVLALKISPAGLKALAEHPDWFDLQQQQEDEPDTDTQTGTLLNLDLLYQLSRYRDWVDVCRTTGHQESDALEYLQLRPQSDSPTSVKEASQQLGRLIGWNADEVYQAAPCLEVESTPVAPEENTLSAFRLSLTAYERNSYNTDAKNKGGALGKLIKNYYEAVADLEPDVSSINKKFSDFVQKFGHCIRVSTAEYYAISTILDELTPRTENSIELRPHDSTTKTFNDCLDTFTLEELNYLSKGGGIRYIFALYHCLGKGSRYTDPLAQSTYEKLRQFIIDNPGPLGVTEAQQLAIGSKSFWTQRIKTYKDQGIIRENANYVELEIYTPDSPPPLEAVQYEYTPLVPASISDIDYILRLQAMSKATGMSCQSLLKLSSLDETSSLAKYKTAAAVLLGACTAEQRATVQRGLQPQWRDALVAYLMSEWVAADANLQAFIPTPDALSNYFLTDVWVTDKVEATPANHAISSLQHYLYRLTAHLEPGYATNPVSAEAQQAWHQYLSEYRKWRIRQERLMHPENLIHHSNRQHKTTAFEELETELNQGKLDTSLVQTAICNYLNKFERLSNLQVISGYLDGDDPLNDTYYLIGKSNSTPVEYYWRSLDMGMRDDKKRLSPLAWSEWQKITLAFTGEILKLSYATEAPNPDKKANITRQADLKKSLAQTKFMVWSKVEGHRTGQLRAYDNESGKIYSTSSRNLNKTISHEEFQTRLQFINSINVGDTIKATTTTDLVRPVVIAGRLYVFWVEREMQGIPEKEDSTKISKYKAITVKCCHLQSDGAWSTANEVIRLDGTYGHERGVKPIQSLFSESWQFTLIVAINDKDEQTSDPWVSVMLAPIGRNVDTRDVDYFLEVFDLFFERKPITDTETGNTIARTLWDRYKNEQKIQSPYGVKTLKKVEAELKGRNEKETTYTIITKKSDPSGTVLLIRYNSQLFTPNAPPRTKLSCAAALIYQNGVKSINLELDANFNDKLQVKLKIPEGISTIESIKIEFDDTSELSSLVIYIDATLEDLPPDTLYAKDLVHLHQTNQTYHLDLSKVPNIKETLDTPYIRLNTLFGKGLVSRATESVERVLAWETQQLPEPIIDPQQDVSALDFHGANGLYFRELFLHLPALVASRLTEQQQFEEAEHWYLNYLFDPYRGNADEQQDQPDRERRVAFWNTRPLAQGGSLSSTLLKAVDPVSRAFVLSRYYRQAIFLSLLENWQLQGDHAYRQLSYSSLNQAWLCYQQALELLGPLPERAAVPRWQPKQLKEIDANCFLSPINRRVIKLRDDLQRRVYNLRHGLTLDGNLLPDMGWADGLDDPLASGKGGFSRVARPYSSSSPIPAYRFRQLLPTARIAAKQLLDFGRHYMKLMEDEFNTSLSVLLKQQEIKLCDFTFSIQQENTAAIKVRKHTLEINKQAALHKRDYLSGLIDVGRNALEISATTVHMAQAFQVALKFPLHIMKSALAPIPDTYGFSIGGHKLSVVPEAWAEAFDTSAAIFGFTADQMLRESEYNRRAQEWEFELKQTEWDIMALDNEIKNTNIELNAATLSLDLIRQDRANLQEAYVAMTTGFTIIPIYNWLVARQEQLYDAARDAVMSLCLSAEAAWRYEIGDYKRPAFIRPSGWRDAYKGMLAGESLLNDLQHMENAYLQANERRVTIKKTFSLNALLGEATLEAWVSSLSAEGEQKTSKKLEFSFAAEHFDQSYPGHYRRQLKHVSVSLQTDALPEDCEISALLTQVASTTLVEADNAGVEYCYPNPKAAQAPTLPDSVKRNLRANQQIALSSARLEDGIGYAPGEWIYELIEHDGRYLPFEGTGAISKWQLEILDDTFAAALKNKLKDVRVTLLYTACDGGEPFRETARAARKAWLELKSGPSDTGKKSNLQPV